jgi:hypothetical protein
MRAKARGRKAKEGGREGGKEGRREGGREGGRETCSISWTMIRSVRSWNSRRVFSSCASKEARKGPLGMLFHA